MALFESVIVGMQIDRVFIHLVPSNCRRSFETLPVTAAKDFIYDHQLVTGHCRLFRIVVGVDVYELDHPVAVSAGGGGKQVGNHITVDRKIFIERLALPAEYVISALQKSLVLYQPGVPGRSPSVSWLNWLLAIRNWIRR